MDAEDSVDASGQNAMCLERIRVFNTRMNHGILPVQSAFGDFGMEVRDEKFIEFDAVDMSYLGLVE